MEWLKLNKDEEVEFNSEECRLVPEIIELMSLRYNKGPKDHDGRKRYRALNELKYMYLAYSPRSPYKDFYEQERLEQARIDCLFPQDWKESPELKAVIDKYLNGSPNKVTRSLKTVEKFLEKFEKHLNSLDLNERTSMGGYVNDPAKVMATLGKLPDFLVTIQELEKQAKFDIIASPKSKGDHELGLIAMNKTLTSGKQRREAEPDEDQDS